MNSWQVRKWRRIRDAGFAMVSLTQREDNLWYVATSRLDTEFMYAPEGSTDITIKKPTPSSIPFGLPSISVSWKALNAVAAVTGLRPKAADAVLGALVHYRSKDMAYGSRSAVFGAPLSINESPRHSGMALLLRLSFSKDIKSPVLLNDLMPTVRWLIQTRLEEGGWAIEEKLRKDGLGPITTAAAIAGLCVYAKLMRRSGVSCAGLEADLEGTVRLAFSLLLNRRVGGLWSNSNEGGAETNQVADTALIISLLALSAGSGMLEDIEKGATSRVHQLQRDLISTALQDGWPAHAGGKTTVISATICALQVLSNLTLAKLPDAAQAHIRAADRRVLSDLTRPDTWQNLRLWDWACLTELAVARVGRLNQSESTKRGKVIEEIQMAKAKHDLSRHLLNRIPSEARKAALYSMTRGGVEPLPSGRFELWWEKRGPLFRYVVVPLWWLSVGIVLKILIDWRFK